MASCSFPVVVFHSVSVAELGDAVPQPPGFTALELETAGACRAGHAPPDLRLQASSRRSVASLQSPIFR